MTSSQLVSTQEKALVCNDVSSNNCSAGLNYYTAPLSITGYGHLKVHGARPARGNLEAHARRLS